MQVINNFLQDMSGSISVTEELRKFYVTVSQLLICFNDSSIVGICNDTCMMLDNLNPLSFGSKNHTRTLKKERLLLHTSAIGHHYACIPLQLNDFKE